MTCSLFYFVYFAAIGILGPYWTLYLKHLQFTSLQISIVYSMPALIRVFFPVGYGYVADRWRIRKHVLRAATIGQWIPLVLLPFLHSYSAWLIAFISFSIFTSVVLPLAEATAQEQHELKKLDYGKTRMWGTLSFILVAAGYGKFLETVSAAWILYGFIFLLLILIFVSFFMPEGHLEVKWSHGPLREIASNRNVWIFLFCALLHNLSQGTFVGFYSIYLAGLGYSDSWIGAQWAIAAASEISIFWFASRILLRFRYRTLFTLCMLAAALRWLLMGITVSYGWLTLYQCLHAFTFGVFHIISMKLIQHFFPEGYRSIGQALYTSIGPGLGTVLGLWFNGALWDHFGARMFGVSAIVSLVAAVISFWLRPDDSQQNQVATEAPG
jgi:PPP family 3-phenylpropionic acid transporter